VIVVVGGNRRKAGKTTVMCEIIAATREADWTAIKLTPHTHEESGYGDTERYLAAGAASALLSNQTPEFQGNVIIESNSILEELNPDFFVFVDDGGERKPSAVKHAAKADAVVMGRAGEEVIARIRASLWPTDAS
jgi:hypothetical protein